MMLTDFSTPAVLAALKANWAEYYTWLGGGPGSELAVGPHLSWCLTGVADPFLNVVFRTRLPRAFADELIAATLAHFRERQVARCSWWAEDERDCPQLGEYLSGQGLTFDEGGLGMAADLAAVPEAGPRAAGLSIEAVEGGAGLRDWVRVMRLGFGLPEGSEPRLHELFAGLTGMPAGQSFLARLNGQPVGTAQLFLGAGVAGIYQVTCVAEARRQGIGGAVTWAALQAARAQGYRIAILQASALGQPVYRRLGFQGCGQLNQYVWADEGEGA